MSSLQPDATAIDRTAVAPFLLRLFWRLDAPLHPGEFSVAPPADTTGIVDYSSLLPPNIKQQTMQIYTWPNCTLAELATLCTSVLPGNIIPTPAVGWRLVFKLIFPDTRAPVSDGGRGKWIDKPLGSVVIGGNGAELDGEADGITLDGDAKKTLAEARFVIGDYVACSIYPPNQDGSVAAPPTSRGPPRDGGFGGPRGPPRENGYGGGAGYGRGGGRGGYMGGGYGGRGGGGFNGPPPRGDWMRGERVPGGYEGGGRGGRDRGGRPY